MRLNNGYDCYYHHSWDLKNYNFYHNFPRDHRIFGKNYSLRDRRVGRGKLDSCYNLKRIQRIPPKDNQNMNPNISGNIKTRNI